MSSYRLASGGRIDRSRPLAFRFDNRALSGYAGDTLASALLANGRALAARSFKLHRPRGIFTAGPDEPNALVELGSGSEREPNRAATMIELFDGLVARSQNRWPGLSFDAMALGGLIAPLLPAGFYYKTFMWPRAFWETLYEPLIRRAAGLGRIADGAGAAGHETIHMHADVLVIGAGAAGLAAACAAGCAGARVLLVEQDCEIGGSTWLDPRQARWRETVIAGLAAAPEVTVLTRTCVAGAYDGNVFAAVERVARAAGPAAIRQRLRIIRARRVVLATGAAERLIAFPGNDRPGVMLAEAALSYLRRHAVAPGRNPVFFVNHDAAYAAAFALAEAGVQIAGIVDPRPDSLAAGRAEALGLPVFRGHALCATGGRLALDSVTIAAIGSGQTRRLRADFLGVSGGHNPRIELASQARLPLQWSEPLASFVTAPRADFALVGAANGTMDVEAAIREAEAAGAGAARALGFRAEPGQIAAIGIRTAPASPLLPLWEVRGTGKAFVDLQHDVTADDIRLAHREGYSHVEHAKRYTTHGMGTDQGRSGGLVGAAILAEARGIRPAEVGLPKHRPYANLVDWGALAGGEVGPDFKPERRLPLHDWHAANGAVFVRLGLWLRPLVYSPAGDSSWVPVLEEARNTRRRVGISDVSSLGKLDIQGPDAAAFLDRVYANTVSTLPVGRARYGLMLREDGIVLDDGTIARLGPEHFVISTTTAKAEEVLLHLEWHLETVWREFDATITNIADQWAQFALAGPKARDVLRRVTTGLDPDNAAFPFMAVAPATIAGVPARLFRISFSGELAYEVAVPARAALPVWEALLKAGAGFGIRPYGLDALNLMRIEKGHVAGSELNGQTAPHDLGLGRMLKKSGDFVGRALLERPGMHAPDRLQLVGLRPLDARQRLRPGAHLIAPGTTISQGFVTAACMASEAPGWLGLALVAGGHTRHGESLLAASPVFGEETEVMITSPHFYDPENNRVRG